MPALDAISLSAMTNRVYLILIVVANRGHRLVEEEGEDQVECSPYVCVIMSHVPPIHGNRRGRSIVYLRVNLI